MSPYILIAGLAACVLVIADGLRRLARDVDRMCIEIERRAEADMPYCSDRPQCAAMDQLRCEECREARR